MTKKRDQIEQFIQEDNIMFANGLDDAIIGICDQSNRIIYSKSKVIEILCNDMSQDEALEFFDHNIGCAYIGEETPIWCNDLMFDM